MILERFAYSPYGTFGRLIVGDAELYTVELPWNNNEPGKSCVPCGEYELEDHSSDKYQDTWALVNHDLGVAHWTTAGIPRSVILMHPANSMADLLGCIGPGTSLGQTWRVNSSRVAMDIIRREKMHGEKLVITNIEAGIWTP